VKAEAETRARFSESPAALGYALRSRGIRRQRMPVRPYQIFDVRACKPPTISVDIGEPSAMFTAHNRHVTITNRSMMIVQVWQ